MLYQRLFSLMHLLFVVTTSSHLARRNLRMGQSNGSNRNIGRDVVNHHRGIYINMNSPHLYFCYLGVVCVCLIASSATTTEAVE